MVDANPFVIAIVLTAPPTREETIKLAWSKIADRFDYERGKLTVAHDLGIVEPITFELIDYGKESVIEAEGVIVARFPKIC